jgi:hypothetical protein
VLLIGRVGDDVMADEALALLDAFGVDLSGVETDVDAPTGVALIAVDGNAPKAFRVGAVVDGTHVLQAVNARGASLGPAGGAPAITLNTVPPAPAATGQLPPAGAGAAPPLRMPSLTMPPQMPPGGSPAPMPVPPQVGSNPAALR